jgi:large subunit ribosomal protein L21
MEPYAVIETGGKQYRVEKNDVLSIERLEAEPGSDVTFDRVLAVSNGEELLVGTPTVDRASITATVMEHIRGHKVVSFKYKKRKGYRRKQGHRQELTRIKIHEFIAEDAPAGKEAEAAAE